MIASFPATATSRWREIVAALPASAPIEFKCPSDSRKARRLGARVGEAGIQAGRILLD